MKVKKLNVALYCIIGAAMLMNCSSCHNVEDLQKSTKSEKDLKTMSKLFSAGNNDISNGIFGTLLHSWIEERNNNNNIYCTYIDIKTLRSIFPTLTGHAKYFGEGLQLVPLLEGDASAGYRFTVAFRQVGNASNVLQPAIGDKFYFSTYSTTVQCSIPSGTCRQISASIFRSMSGHPFPPPHTTPSQTAWEASTHEAKATLFNNTFNNIKVFAPSAFLYLGELQKLIDIPAADTPDLVGIIICIGYDDTASLNKIRLIAFAVAADAQGQIHLDTTKEILERMWP